VGSVVVEEVVVEVEFFQVLQLQNCLLGTHHVAVHDAAALQMHPPDRLAPPQHLQQLLEGAELQTVSRQDKCLHPAVAL
jgi:hypothetical protein